MQTRAQHTTHICHMNAILLYTRKHIHGRKILTAVQHCIYEMEAFGMKDKNHQN